MDNELFLKRISTLDNNFIIKVMKHDFPKAKTFTTMSDSSLSPAMLLTIFRSQLECRHLDLKAIELNKYSSCSLELGSEGLATIPTALLPNDLLILSDYNQAFLLQRERLLGEEPWLKQHLFAIINQDKNLILYNPANPSKNGTLLNILPYTDQTSHLPKALGTALSICLANNLLAKNPLLTTNKITKNNLSQWVAKILRPKIIQKPSAKTSAKPENNDNLNLTTNYPSLPDNSVVICDFNATKFNHSIVQGTLNAAEWLAEQEIHLPIVFICEEYDFNRISTVNNNNNNWIENNLTTRKTIYYLVADGLNIFDTYLATTKAIELARKDKQPVFLHIKTINLLPSAITIKHILADLKPAFNQLDLLTLIEAEDPLLHSARLLIEHGILTAEQIVRQYEDIRRIIRDLAVKVINQPHSTDLTKLTTKLIPPNLNRTLPIAKTTATVVNNTQSMQIAPSALSTELQPSTTTVELANALSSKKCTLEESLIFSLHDLLNQYPNLLLMCNCSDPGSIDLSLTYKLQKNFNLNRIFITHLDDTIMLGLAIGAANNGLLPILELASLSCLHRTISALYTEVAMLPFLSNGQLATPMVIRIPALSHQQIYQDHNYNDNCLNYLREIPGILIACPSSAKDAPALLRSCVALAYQEQRTVIFLEPSALYHTKDLLVNTDHKWLHHYSKTNKLLSLGKISISGESNKLAIVSYGYGCYLAQKAAAIIRQKHAINLKLIDLHWLNPLPKEGLLIALKNMAHILIIDETRRGCSISESLYTLFVEELSPLPKIKRITSEDIFIPQGNNDAWQHISPKLTDIIAEIEKCLTVHQLGSC